MRLNPIYSLVLTIPLVACGASSDGFEPIVLAAGQQALLADADTAVLSAALADVQSTNVPQSTVVRYDGTFAGRTVIAGRNDQIMVGDLRLQADFDNNELSGTIRNFEGTDISGRSSDFSGRLRLDGDVLRDGDTAQVEMGALGTLTDTSGREVDYDLDLVGGFRGDEGAFILGTASGDISARNGSGLSTTATFADGGFVAER